ncbi:MAG TPA: DUF2071 domain-containing protein [Microlunatus sp.]
MPIAEEITSTAPRSLRRRLLRQEWRDVSMVHWPADPEAVARLVPPGTVPDRLHGTTYVGLIGFRMYGLGLGVGPAIPYLGTFLETNVRLYTVDVAGRRGVYFCSLDAERLPAVIGARVGVRLPYMWSRMRLDRSADVLSYTCRRRWPGPAARSTMRVRVGAEIDEASELDAFLTARWGLHTQWYGRTIYLPNVHETWPLHRAELVERDDPVDGGLLAAAGFRVDGAPVSTLYASQVRVAFGPATVVDGRA